MIKILLLLLFGISTCFAQLANDLAFPPPTSSGSSANHKAWESFGKYWHADAVLNRLRVKELESAAGVPGDIITQFVSSLYEIQTTLNSLTSTAAFVATHLPQPLNVSVVSNGTEAKLSWIYDYPITNISGFRIETSTNGGIDYALHSTASATARSATIKSVQPGTWIRITTFWIAMPTSSLPSNPVQHNPPVI